MRHGHPWRVQTDGARGVSRDIRPTAPSDEFDELVVGDWLHLERMSTAHWWVRVGEVQLGFWREPKRGDRAARWRVVVQDDLSCKVRGRTCSKCGNVED